jgi:hypothetical protein
VVLQRQQQGKNESRRKARTSPSKHPNTYVIIPYGHYVPGIHDFNQISVKSIVRTSSFIHRLTTSPNTVFGKSMCRLNDMAVVDWHARSNFL